jgi:hypothetical protein
VASAVGPGLRRSTGTAPAGFWDASDAAESGIVEPIALAVPIPRRRKRAAAEPRLPKRDDPSCKLIHEDAW